MAEPILQDYWRPAERWVTPRNALHHVVARVRMLRIEAEMSKRRLAFACGTQPARIRTLERGEHDPGLDLLARIARALGVDLVDLCWDLRFDPPIRKTLARQRDPEARKKLRGQQLEPSETQRPARQAEPEQSRVRDPIEPETVTEEGEGTTPTRRRVSARRDHTRGR